MRRSRTSDGRAGRGFFPSGVDNGGFAPVNRNLAYVSADEVA
jgi:hypothetical protein